MYSMVVPVKMLELTAWMADPNLPVAHLWWEEWSWEERWSLWQWWLWVWLKCLWPHQTSWELQVPQRELNAETHVQSIKGYRRVAAIKNWLLWNGCENNLVVCTGGYWGADPVIQFFNSSLSACSQLGLLSGMKEGSLQWGTSLCWESELNSGTHSTCASERVKMSHWRTQQLCIYHLGSGCGGIIQVVTLALEGLASPKQRKYFYG